MVDWSAVLQDSKFDHPGCNTQFGMIGNGRRGDSAAALFLGIKSAGGASDVKLVEGRPFPDRTAGLVQPDAPAIETLVPRCTDRNEGEASGGPSNPKCPSGECSREQNEAHSPQL